VNDDARTVIELLVLLPGLLIVAVVAIRLLGVRRSWSANLISVGIAAILGVLGGWILAGRDIEQQGFVRDSLALTFLLTMVAAVGADLLARPGSLSHGDAAGLFVVPRPGHYVQERVDTFRRTREIVQIARANGFGHLLGRGKEPTDENASPTREPTAVRARSALEQMGGMFVKLGQVASTRSDLLPPDVIAEFAQLQDNVAVEPRPAMQALIEEELGRPAEAVFAEFDWTPVAAASIGQVYFATLATGEPVVIKAQRPGVAAKVERDLGILLRLTERVQESTPQGRQYRVHDLAQEFADGLRAELDFQVEGRSTTEIGKNMVDEVGIRAPHIYDEYSTKRLLVQERLDGVSIRESEVITELGFDTVDLADRLLRAALRQMLTDGLFHADLHPGNVFVLRDGDLGMIDFGATGRLDPLTQASLRQILLAVNVRDAGMLRQAVSEVCTIGQEVDLDALERALSRFMSIHISAGSSVDAAALHDLLGLLGRFGIRVPADLTTFSRALVILEGTLATLSPGFSLPDHAQQVASEWVSDRFNTESLGDLARNEVLGLVPILRQLPRHADRIATQVERGDLLVRVSMFSTPEDRNFVTKMVNRVMLGFLGAALGAISVVLISLSKPTLVTSQEFFEVFGYVGLLGSIVLILRVVASVVREGLS
jgi:ubiquinone biosynthesis protein